MVNVEVYLNCFAILTFCHPEVLFKVAQTDEIVKNLRFEVNQVTFKLYIPACMEGSELVDQLKLPLPHIHIYIYTYRETYYVQNNEKYLLYCERMSRIWL